MGRSWRSVGRIRDINDFINSFHFIMMMVKVMDHKRFRKIDNSTLKGTKWEGKTGFFGDIVYFEIQ